ncbi:MAG: GNAT family N-acetyltransferase [Alphaproteobacteria bacterium]|nr:GNAT family N-acetyltransferase [Alphaproteobacteria bacterium]MCB9698147.1 GNAT family N-acetyltransferase [Alphaproteobacteria bacterium]
MPQGVRQRPDPDYADPTRRRSLMALLDDGFPGLSERIDVAGRDGFDWDLVTWPTIVWDGDEAVGHVGLIEHRVMLDGQDVLTGGIHAVVTRSDRRGRGIARDCLARALADADQRFAVTKLGTDLPAVYAPHGFVPITVHLFAVDHAGGEHRGRPLAEADRASFLDLCARRDPVSWRFASLDPGWLVGIDLALQRRTLADLVALDELGAVVDWEVRDGVLHLHDVFAEELPALRELLALAPPHTSVRLAMCPDRLAPDAVPFPQLDEGVLMARGAWPLPADVPLGLSRLAEH